MVVFRSTVCHSYSKKMDTSGVLGKKLWGSDVRYIEQMVLVSVSYFASVFLSLNIRRKRKAVPFSSFWADPSSLETGKRS